MEYKLDLRDNARMSKNMGGGIHGISNKYLWPCMSAQMLRILKIRKLKE
jgi:hypothetical protein